MVLKSSCLFLLVSLFAISISVVDEGPLYDQYQNKIEKNIAKIFKEEGAIKLLNMETPQSNYEHYSIFINDNITGYLFIKEVKACSLNGCPATNKNVVTNNVGAEYFDLAVIVNDQSEIQNIKVLDYFSDYGYEIASKRYLKQYNGKSICHFSTEQPQVDGISGATISYNSLIESLEEFCQNQYTLEASFSN